MCSLRSLTCLQVQVLPRQGMVEPSSGRRPWPGETLVGASSAVNGRGCRWSRTWRRPLPPGSGLSRLPGCAISTRTARQSRHRPPTRPCGGRTPPENRQNSPVDALRQVWQNRAMNESEKQFFFTRVALSTCGRAKNQIPISNYQRASSKLYKLIFAIVATIWLLSREFMLLAQFALPPLPPINISSTTTNWDSTLKHGAC